MRAFLSRLTGPSAFRPLAVVTLIAIRSPGTGYAVGDTLSVVVGALAGAVFTVTAIAPSDNAAGNVTAQRIAAGSTSAPQGLSTSLGLTSSRSFIQVLTSPTTGNGFPYRSYIASSSDDEPSGFYVLPQETSLFSVLSTAHRVDFRQRTANSTVVGVRPDVSIWYQNASGSAFVNGVNAVASAAGPNLVGGSINLIGVFPQVTVQNTVTNANTFTTHYAIDCFVGCSSPVAQLISNSGYLVPRSASFSGAAHAITNWYGLWLPAQTLSNGTAITNRYNVAQDDVNGKNNFRSKVFVGTALTATQQTAALARFQATSSAPVMTMSSSGTSL